MTLREFIRKNHIRIKNEWTDSNPCMDDSSNMDHWKVTVYAQPNIKRTQMMIYFSKGYGHHGKEPQVDEVLDCLLSDSAGVENARSFEDWASDYGYDTDSHKAEKIFKNCEMQAAKLRKLLGDNAYNTLLWETERL